ncbi:MAG TPA: TetR/AcrR family transcriptional regulator [Rhizobacter sp.]|nr:TetR/AcrR family transcriptional regulator [Rhizobacter sp.]
MKLRILDAADRLFYGHGIQAVGVDAVAAEAGISKRTLYNHFPSKDELIAAYLQRRTAGLGAIDGPPLTQILGAFDFLARWFGSKHFRGCPFVNAVSELSGDRQHPAMAIAAAQKAKRLAHFEAQLQALGVADAGGVAQQLVILFEGAIAISLVRGGDPKAAHAARAAACTLLVAAGVKLPKETGA